MGIDNRVIVQLYSCVVYNIIWLLRYSEKEGGKGIVYYKVFCVKLIVFMGGRRGVEVGEGISESLVDCFFKFCVFSFILEMQILFCFFYIYIYVYVYGIVFLEFLLQFFCVRGYELYFLGGLEL